ncbi:solute carrier family 52, riboflavin transporter, member 3 isoform X2 [Dendropsophus ebraccatus]|uniref:solute carrier family 52, riboflavin transporter, member 3 isoform X2 n=1 Tax=Dendropsophus ebraccatus TaxID=150705 RepID=UPI003831B687
MAFVTHLLACIFGTGAWVAINGLWVELPLIVNDLPEGWYLPSYLTILIQMANIGPLFVTVMHKAKPGWLREVAVIYAIVVLGIVALFLLAFFWKETTWIAGQLHSTGFLILTFFLSMVDCTSSVTFLPFMIQLQPKYITTYFIGEGLSGLFPGLLSLIQGVGMMKCVNVTRNENTTQPWLNGTNGGYYIETQYLPANFSVQVFLFLLTIMMVFCLVSFFFLTRVSKEDSSNTSLLQSSVTLNSYSTTDVKLSCNSGPSDTTKSTEDINDGSGDSSDTNKVKYSWGHYALIYSLTGWVNALTNGVLPSIQTYSCMPYGNLAYHLSAALGSMANPLACLIAMFLPCRSLIFLVLLSVLGTGFGAYNMMTAVMSPCPILQNSTWGVVLIVRHLLGSLYRITQLCESHDWSHSPQPESQRPPVVWSSGAAGIHDRRPCHVPPG